MINKSSVLYVSGGRYDCVKINGLILEITVNASNKILWEVI